ncbi:unnamed protein product [Durusdinium trenchii]|uniref:Methyltransferase domain-containing protein n=1 Tax=Durusdinium trenchii TaxID=1381693 RepID=A0ABP0MD20_9DINO
MMGSGRLRVLDAGCGCGGQLLELAHLAEARHSPALLRGLTAEQIQHRCAVKLQPRVISFPGGCKNEVADADLIDLLIYQGFPLEDITLADVDFVKEGQLFDLILCSWTLFHLCDPLGTLLQLRQFLDREGVMLVNGAYLHFELPSPPQNPEPMDLFRRFCEELRSYGVETCVTGGPIRWLQGEGEDGDYVGGYEISMQWLGNEKRVSEIERRVFEICGFSSQAVLDKVWCLASGPQYCVSSYELRL